jgi:tetratricopeptide (TPR) repeat protein
MSRFIIISLAFLFCHTLDLKGQTTAEFDSLYQVAVNSKTDSAKSYNYESAVRGLVRSNPDSAISIANLALSLAEKVGDSVLISDAYNSLGICYKQVGNFSRGYKFLKKAIDYARTGGIHEERAKGTLGLTYWEQGQYSSALEIFYERLLTQEKHKDTSSIARLYNNIANIYFEQNLLEKAKTNYEEAYKLAVVMGSKFGQCLLLNNLGSVYYKQKKYDLAMENFQKSYKLSVELEDVEGMGISYINFAGVYFENKEFKKA